MLSGGGNRLVNARWTIMKSNLWRNPVSLFYLVAALFACPQVDGGPFQRSDVAAGATWVAHVDFDALRATTVGKFVMAQLDTPDVRANFSGFQQVFGFDLLTELHGATLYGIGTAPQDGLLLFYADFNPDRLAVLAESAPDAAKTKYKKHVIYDWRDENKPAVGGKLPRVYAAIRSNLVVFGQQSVRVAQALDVLDGVSKNLSSSQSFAPLGAPGDSTFVEAAANQLNVSDAVRQTPALKLVKTGLFQFGESHGNMNLTLTLDAIDQEAAGQMLAVVKGVVAALELQRDQPELLQLAKGFALKLEGTNLEVSIAYPASNLLDLLKAKLKALEALGNQAENGS